MVLLSGQSFSLTKCSASRECKSRSRRTKEQRKSMVLSFIKKYQSSNHGKFPSLNLTQKEVGGSFYTIREIMRDLIQENKVLCPGNPSSKLINLEYYSDGDDKHEGSFLDVDGNISLLGADFGISQDLLLKDGETCLRDDFAKGSAIHEKLAYSEIRESSTHLLTTEDKNALQTEEQTNAEVWHDGLRDYPTELHSVYPTSSEEEQYNGIPLITHCFEERSNISGSLSKSRLISADIADDHSNCNAKSDDRKVLFDSTVFDILQISTYVHKVQLPSEPVVKEVIICSSELELEERRVMAEGQYVDNSVLQSNRSTFFAEKDMLSVDKTINFVDAVGVSENAYSKPNKTFKSIIKNENHSDIKEGNHLDVKVANHSDFEVEKHADVFNAVKGECFISSSKEVPTEEHEMLGTKSNPMWAAFKAFVSFVIKFWSE